MPCQLYFFSSQSCKVSQSWTRGSISGFVRPWVLSISTVPVHLYAAIWRPLVTLFQLGLSQLVDNQQLESPANSLFSSSHRRLLVCYSAVLPFSRAIVKIFHIFLKKQGMAVFGYVSEFGLSLCNCCGQIQKTSKDKIKKNICFEGLHENFFRKNNFDRKTAILK